MCAQLRIQRTSTDVLGIYLQKEEKHFKLCCIHCCRVAREIPVVGIPSGNYREILEILAQAGNTGKYDF